MTVAEYTAVADTLLSLRPTATLVFGAGRDSDLWASLIPDGGFILFVEDSPQWSDETLAPVLRVKYHGTRDEWRTRDPLTVMPDVWPMLGLIDWDLILVDGPRGDTATSPGRLGPLAFSGRYPNVIVHDVHREAERGLCERYFAGRDCRDVHHLRLYT